jgi:exportin-1
VLYLATQQWDVFKTTVDAIAWAMKHHERNISELGLAVLKELLVKIESTEIAQKFYSAFFISLVRDVFAVLSDTLHKTGFKLQAEILHMCFTRVCQGGVTVPLFDTSAASFADNATFLQHDFGCLLTSAFPHLDAGTIQVRNGRVTLALAANSMSCYVRWMHSY